MGFGFNFKDYNDRLTFKKSTLKDVKQTLDERDFLKAEISKKDLGTHLLCPREQNSPQSGFLEIKK